MKQYTLTDIEYSKRKKKTRREEFLDTMNRMIPWDHWIDLIKPYYPSGKRGRPTRGIETMLRMYLMQNWFNLSDAGLEDAIYDSYAMRSFMNIDFYKEQVPDATTLLKFRHLLEEHHIGEQIFADVNSRLEECGLIMHGGSIVDATIVSAPSSTKNKEGKRNDRERPKFNKEQGRQTRSGNASDQKGESMVSWHENPCRSRCRKWLCSYDHGDICKCARYRRSSQTDPG